MVLAAVRGTGCPRVLVIAALTLALAPGLASAAPGAPAGKPGASAQKKRSACVPARVGGKRVCLRLGARCSPSRRLAYLGAGLDCVKRRGKRVLVRASPAAVRQGRYIALPASGRPTFAQALAAFDASVAALPGVDPAPGSVGSTPSGSAATRWLYDVRDRLTPAQRSVLDEVTKPAPGAITVDIDADGNVVDGSVAAPPPPAPVVPAGPEPDPVAPAAPDPVVPPEPDPVVPPEPDPVVPPEPDPVVPAEPQAPRRARAAEAGFTPITPEQLESFRGIVVEAVARLRAKGVVLRRPVLVSAAGVAAANPGVNANAWPLWLARHPQEAVPGNGCSVRIYPGATTGGLAYVRQVLLHELSHCAQFEFLANIGQLGPVPGYVSDGTAEYFAYTISQEWNRSPPVKTAWQSWLRNPGLDLFKRQYDGVGFWFLLAQKGASIPGLLGPLIQAGSPSVAYDIADAAVTNAHVIDWGPTAAGIIPFGPLWHLTHPAVERPLLSGSPLPYTAEFGPRGAAATFLVLRDDIVTITMSRGAQGRLRDAKGVDRVLTPAMTFCLRPGGCSCPGEGPGERAPHQPLAKGTTYLGVADARGGGSISVTGESLRKNCEKQREGAGGAGGGGGPGLQIRSLADGTELLGTITRGTCSFTGTAFVARGSGSGFRFEMRIAGARQPGQYDIPNNSSATFVRVSNGRAAYSTVGRNTEVLGTEGPRTAGTAIINRVRVRVGKRTVTRHRIVVGIDDLVSGGRPGVAMLPGPGGLTC